MNLKGFSMILALWPGTMIAQEVEIPVEQVACFDVLAPVISLDYGSRYTDDSKDRSDLDASSNAAVNAALGPIDDFIIDLTTSANIALQGGEGAVDAANCVVDAIAVWARADALSDLRSMNAQISSPSRLGGMAFAWQQAAPVANALDADTRVEVEDWFRRRAQAIAVYFDEDAPKGASRNNLRAWAGLAVAISSRVSGDADLAQWAADTVELVVCQADADGALPLEMARGPRALHYQVHAVGPLVVSAALLKDTHQDLFTLCDGALHRIVSFLPLAFENLRIAEAKAGEPQTYQISDDTLRSFELAWADAYLSMFDDPDIALFVKDFRPLANSKLGGDQTLLWGGCSKPVTGESRHGNGRPIAE